LATLLAGCSSDGGMLGSSLTTASVDGVKAATAKPDPACVALTAKIDALRKDGVTERVEKAAEGKSTTVSVKRESLAKMTELDKANADYQAKCSIAGLNKPVSAPVATGAAPAAAASAAAAAAKPAAAKKTVAAAVAKPAAVVAPAAAAIAPPAPVVPAAAVPAQPTLAAPVPAAAP